VSGKRERATGGGRTPRHTCLDNPVRLFRLFPVKGCVVNLKSEAKAIIDHHIELRTLGSFFTTVRCAAPRGRRAGPGGGCLLCTLMFVFHWPMLIRLRCATPRLRGDSVRRHSRLRTKLAASRPLGPARGCGTGTGRTDKPELTVLSVPQRVIIQNQFGKTATRAQCCTNRLRRTCPVRLIGPGAPRAEPGSR
jgi:hypothetical protein